MRQLRYETPSGIRVLRSASKVNFKKGLKHLASDLDKFRGFYLSSGYEFPGRYSRWDIASTKPPLEIVAQARNMEFRALNLRGEMLLNMLLPFLSKHPHWESLHHRGRVITGTLLPLPKLFSEEERSKQPSVFSILRAFVAEFSNPNDGRLGLTGSFGYDLLFQFDPIELKLPRGEQKDLHLFLSDDVYYMDRKREVIERYEYDFEFNGFSTVALERSGEEIPAPPKLPSGPVVSNHTPEQYMAGVESVREGMRRGDYYEVVLRQTFSTPYADPASKLFERIQKASPSPYEFLLQLGDEQLIGASPEMFIRVEGRRVESCPIAGTARRTGDPLVDHENIRNLLNSTKEESELTMCTDVDRNDKSRVCEPGTVKVIGRRLIEAYAGLFHTVDHVEGMLKEGFDSIDAFLSHMWAVTIIGAPKKAAAQAIEDREKTARGWYGGAVGMLSLNGDLNTGILIRTVHLKDGMASYPAGATLLYDSDPASEDAECHVKATGFFRALEMGKPKKRVTAAVTSKVGQGVKMLLVDNEDCFIQTLASYARETGAEVVTYRWGMPPEMILELNPDIILISPGPGRPEDFGVPQLVRFAAERKIPTFGVCLGLQGIVEAFGGTLGVLGYPMHGKPSVVHHTNAGVFEGLPENIRVGRYHSLFANPKTFPDVLEVTARTEDGVIMGVQHKTLPIEAVQFHPESILSFDGGAGLKMIENMVRIYGHLK